MDHKETLFVLFAAALGIGFYMSPLAQRNNNPLNVRYDPKNDWLGQVGENKGFVVFKNPVYGFRAAMKIFNSYNRRGITTLENIIETFAPPTENKTANYIRYVSQQTGIPPSQVVNKSDYVKLVKAMSKMESNADWDIALIQKAYALI